MLFKSRAGFYTTLLITRKLRSATLMVVRSVQPNPIVLEERASVAIVVIHAIYNLSTTDVECNWLMQKAPEAVKSVIFFRPQGYMTVFEGNLLLTIANG